LALTSTLVPSASVNGGAVGGRELGRLMSTPRRLSTRRLMSSNLPAVDRSMDRGTRWNQLFAKLQPNSSFPSRAEMQQGAFRRYLHWLYNLSGDALHQRHSQRQALRWNDFDLLYLDSVLGSPLRESQVVLPPHCPMDEQTPYMGRVVHAPRQVAWFRRSAPFEPRLNSSWVEVTHCSGSRFEHSAYWAYAARGSGFYINVGRTIAFAGHKDAASYFLGRACHGPRWCGGEPTNACLMQCNHELPAIMDAAKYRGFDSVQFVGHCDMRCAACGHEIALVGIAGVGACSSSIEYRQGADANQPCECVASPVLTSERGMCATCRGSGRDKERRAT